MKKKLGVLLMIMSVLTILTACDGDTEITVTIDQPTDQEIEVNEEIEVPEVVAEPTITVDVPVNYFASLDDYTQDASGLIYQVDLQYNEALDVYYQYEIAYSAMPEASDIESLGIMIPGAYVNEDGTWNPDAVVNDYTVDTAPIILPISSVNYNGQSPLTDVLYEPIVQYQEYLNEGLIVVHVGFRGSNAGVVDDTVIYSGGAPWAITDLKAAIQYLRFNEEALPGDLNQLFAVGANDGATLATILGASGNYEAYNTYLMSIGALMYDTSGELLSNEIQGVVSVNANTSFTYSNLAYESLYGTSQPEERYTEPWMSDLTILMDEAYQTAQSNDSLSNLLDDEVLEEAIASGIETFLLNTVFPYNPAENMDTTTHTGGGGKGQGTREDSTTTEPVSMETELDYITFLNRDFTWITYDETSKDVSVDLSGYVTYVSKSTAQVSVLDGLYNSTMENKLFGTDSVNNVNYSQIILDMLIEANAPEEVILSFEEALLVEDKYFTSTTDRVLMMDSFLLLSEEVDLADHWMFEVYLDDATNPFVQTNLFAEKLLENECTTVVDYSWNSSKSATLSELMKLDAINWIDEMVKG